MTLSTFLRPTAVLALALCLAACGGTASFPINGVASNVLYDGMVLTTNGMDLAVPKGTTAFSFPNSISYGDVYRVTFKSLPAHQNCSTTDQSTGVETASGTAGRTAGINLVVTCALNTATIGGNVSGLTTGTVVLTNGSTGGTVSVAAGTTTYTFPNSVTYGNTYGVTVLTQPTGAFCTVANAAGVMGDAAITNIDITCVSTVPAAS